MQFKIGRGVRQTDTIWPKLFTSILENVFEKWDRREIRIKINGKRLSHPPFVDDMVLIAANLDQVMLA